MSEIIEVNCKKFGFNEDHVVCINKSHITFVEISKDSVVLDVIGRSGIEFRDNVNTGIDPIEFTSKVNSFCYTLDKSELAVLKTKLG